MDETRRAFLRYLASSPLLLPFGAAACRSDGGKGPLETTDGLMPSPADALNVFDFRHIAERTLPPAHYGYLATGATLYGHVL